MEGEREREKSYFLVCAREILFQFCGRERIASFFLPLPELGLVFFENELGKLVINSFSNYFFRSASVISLCPSSFALQCFSNANSRLLFSA
jgi:hypothetical protein